MQICVMYWWLLFVGLLWFLRCKQLMGHSVVFRRWYEKEQCCLSPAVLCIKTKRGGSSARNSRICMVWEELTYAALPLEAECLFSRIDPTTFRPQWKRFSNVPGLPFFTSLRLMIIISSDLGFGKIICESLAFLRSVKRVKPDEDVR